MFLPFHEKYRKVSKPRFLTWYRHRNNIFVTVTTLLQTRASVVLPSWTWTQLAIRVLFLAATPSIGEKPHSFPRSPRSSYAHGANRIPPVLTAQLSYRSLWSNARTTKQSSEPRFINKGRGRDSPSSVKRVRVYSHYSLIAAASDWYQYTVLSFRLSLVLRTFTKCADAALAPLRQSGIVILNNLNDWLILVQPKQENWAQRSVLLQHLAWLQHVLSLAETRMHIYSQALPSNDFKECWVSWQQYPHLFC